MMVDICSVASKYIVKFQALLSGETSSLGQNQRFNNIQYIAIATVYIERIDTRKKLGILGFSCNLGFFSALPYPLLHHNHNHRTFDWWIDELSRIWRAARRKVRRASSNVCWLAKNGNGNPHTALNVSFQTLFPAKFPVVEFPVLLLLPCWGC